MNTTGVIANYLPQFHAIPENDKWWGKDYTDWVAVKKSKPMFEGHRQPRVPLDHNYYDLTDVEELKRQANLANEYGVYGFGMYHYWFSSDLKLLERPAELILNNQEIDIHYMFIWDNESWKRTWSIKGGNDWAPEFDSSAQMSKQIQERDSGLLAELRYGTEKDWIIHFNYLLPFFKDARYIKIGNKPLFALYQPNNDYDTIIKMCKCWNRLAQENGIEGIIFLSKKIPKGVKLDYTFSYEPLGEISNLTRLGIKIKRKLNRIFPSLTKYDYDVLWRRIISKAKEHKDSTHFHGAFVDFDDTPRRGKKARIVFGATPEKFKNYMSQLLAISSQQGKEFIFLTAWNEWGEGAYLEPDVDNGYAYLEALKEAVDSVRVNGEGV